MSETPEGKGYRAAAIRMAAHFRMKPMAADGQNTAGAFVTIPITFKLGDTPASEIGWWPGPTTAGGAAPGKQPPGP